MCLSLYGSQALKNISSQFQIYTNIYCTISYFNKCMLYLSTNLFMTMLDYNYISILQINYLFKTINVKSNVILSKFYKQNTCSQVSLPTALVGFAVVFGSKNVFKKMTCVSRMLVWVALAPYWGSCGISQSHIDQKCVCVSI